MQMSMGLHGSARASVRGQMCTRACALVVWGMGLGHSVCGCACVCDMFHAMHLGYDVCRMQFARAASRMFHDRSHIVIVTPDMYDTLVLLAAGTSSGPSRCDVFVAGADCAARSRQQLGKMPRCALKTNVRIVSATERRILC